MSKRLVVRTSTLDYQGDDRLDITVKQGKEAFAPAWDWVIRRKLGQMDKGEYTRLYTERMRWSYVNYRRQWKDLLEMRQVTLCCFCEPGTFCHRNILKHIIRKICESKGIEFIDGGEV